MTEQMQSLFRAFENTLFVSASDEFNERASPMGIEARYKKAQLARKELIAAIEKLEQQQHPSKYETNI